MAVRGINRGCRNWEVWLADERRMRDGSEWRRGDRRREGDGDPEILGSEAQAKTSLGVKFDMA
jgi:hypothetical protein